MRQSIRTTKLCVKLWTTKLCVKVFEQTPPLLFEWFWNIESIRTTKLCVKLYSWYEVKNINFLIILHLKVVPKMLSVPTDRTFWVPLDHKMCAKRVKNGFWDVRKPNLMSQIVLEYSGNDSEISKKNRICHKIESWPVWLQIRM